MKKFLPLAAIATLGVAACTNGDADTASVSDSVVVTVTNVSESGTVYVALQDESNFGAVAANYGATAMASEATDGSVDVTIEGVAPGDYAIAVFQDTNDNGQMDVGSNGVPTEPWALSGGAGTTGAPQFSDARITFDGTDRETIALNR